MGTWVYGNLNSDGQRPIEIVQPYDRRGASKRRGGFAAGTLITGGGRSFPFASNDGGVILTADGALIGNPHWPCIAGPEVVPVGPITVAVDQGSGWYFDGHLPSTSGGITSSTGIAQFEFDGARSQHVIAFDVFSTGNELGQDDPIEVTCPAYVALIGPDASVVGGGTALNAVTVPGVSQVRLDGALESPYVLVQFDTSDLVNNFPNSRVGRIGVRWLAWRDNSAIDPAPGEGFDVWWFDTGSSGGQYLHGSWAVTDYESNATYQTRWLGETNFISRGRRNTSLPLHEVHPFTVYDLSNMQAGIEQTAILLYGKSSWDETQSVTFLDYIELVVEILPERRSMGGSRVVSNLSGDAYPVDMEDELHLYFIQDDRFLFQPDPNSDWTLLLREAQPADPSDRYRAITIESTVNEEQLIVVNQTGLTNYTLTFQGQTTAAIAPAATAAAVQAALEALSNIAPGDIFVASVIVGGPYQVTFIGTYLNQNVTEMTATPNPATGSVTVTTTVEGGQTFQYTRTEPVGPSILLKGVQQHRGLRNLGDGDVAHRLGTISNGRLVGTPVSYEPFALAATIRDANYLNSGAWWASYENMAFEVDSIVADTYNITQYYYADGATSYNRIKVVAKPDIETTAPLRFRILIDNVLVDTLTVTAADVRDLAPDIGNGWREFSVALNAPITPPSGWNLKIIIDSVTGATQFPWRVAGALSTGDKAWTGYDPGPESAFHALFTDFAVTFLCPLPAAAITSASATNNGNPTGVGCNNIDNPDVWVVNLSWNQIVEADIYVIERRLTGGDWETIALQDETGDPAGYLFIDVAPPWDVAIQYRINTYRYSDRSLTLGTPVTPTATPVPSPGAAIGITAPCLSNDPLTDCASEGMYWIPTEESGTLSIQWEDLTVSEVIQLHGEDDNRVLQPDENRGMRVTFSVLMDQVSVSCAVNALTVGARSLNPDPYAIIRSLAREPYVNVQFPGGMTRKMHLQLGSMVVRTQFGVYAAELVLTDAHVTALDLDPETD